MPNIANLFTTYRIVAAPFVAGLALWGLRDAFFIALIVSLATDAVDGPIARWTGTVSERGARLDSIADGMTTLAGLVGIYLFAHHAIAPDIAWVYAFLASYALAALVCLIKFGLLPSYHLWLSKIGAVMAAAFVIWLYLFGYSQVFFIAVLAVAIAANLNSLITTFRLKRFRADIGGDRDIAAGD